MEESDADKEEKTVEEKVEIFTFPISNEEFKREPETKSCCQIDKEMLPFKINFFLYYAAVGAVLPYWAIVAKVRVGITATAFSSILITQLFITIVSKPCLCYIADYFSRLKLLIGLLMSCQTLLYFLLLAIPPVQHPLPSPEASFTLNHLKNYDHNFDSLHIKIGSCKSASGNSIEENALHLNEKNQIDVFCIRYLNLTEVCYLGRSTFEIRNDLVFDTELSGCCSVSFLNFKQFEDQFSVSKAFPVTISLNISVPLENLNETTSCTAIIEERDPSLNHVESQILSDFSTYQFWCLGIVMVLGSTCHSTLSTLFDTICLESIQKFGGDFGKQRLFSAFSWGALAPISGLLCDATHDFVASWILMAIFNAMTFLNIYKMRIIKPHFSQNIMKDVGNVFKTTEFLLFDFGVLLNGISCGILWFYISWYLSSLGASQFLIGLVPYVQCFAGELPFMFYSGWFINKIGNFNLLSLSLLCYALRYVGYSYLQDPWYVLFYEIFHGVNYGVFYPAVASYGKLKSRPGTEATTQSILFATHEGLGAGIGCVLAGVGFDNLGGHSTFFYFSVFCTCALVLNMLGSFIVKRQVKTRSTLQPLTTG